MIEAIIKEVESWLIANSKCKGFSLSDFVRDWVIVISCSPHLHQNHRASEWSLPPIGKWKLNFDGASKRNPCLTGFGCVVHVHNDTICKVMCGLLGLCNSKRAESLSLRELKKMGIS